MANFAGNLFPLTGSDLSTDANQDSSSGADVPLEGYAADSNDPGVPKNAHAPVNVDSFKGFKVPVGQQTVQQTGGLTETLIYRGFDGSKFVYSKGSPPSGTTFVTIVGKIVE